jgi:hypothetical protein
MAKTSVTRPQELADLVCLLEAIKRGKPVAGATLAAMRNNGLVGGSEHRPILTGKGRAMLDAELKHHEVYGQTAVHIPDVLQRLANPRKGEAALLAIHDGAAAGMFQNDLERSGLRQRITQNWSYASLVLKPGKQAVGSQGNEPVLMMDARERVRLACTAIGPELSGLLVDICLYDKSLAQIEQERGWPARSGKLAVALGLKALARHYGLDQMAQGPAPANWPAHG